MLSCAQAVSILLEAAAENKVDEFLKILAPVVLKKGNFTLRNGKESNIYLDVKKAYGDSYLLNSLADNLWKIIDKRTTCVAAYGVGGIALATAISSRSNVRLSIIRQEVKNYGTQQKIEGHVPAAEDFVTIVDDVFTTGSSFREASEIIKETKANILGYAVVVNRQEGKEKLEAPLSFLYRAEEIYL